MIGIFGLRFSNLEALKSINRQQFFKDVIAGIIVAVIALPLSIAFALGAGVSAEKVRGGLDLPRSSEKERRAKTASSRA